MLNIDVFTATTQEVFETIQILNLAKPAAIQLITLETTPIDQQVFELNQMKKELLAGFGGAKIKNLENLLGLSFRVDSPLIKSKTNGEPTYLNGHIAESLKDFGKTFSIYSLESYSINVESLAPYLGQRKFSSEDTVFKDMFTQRVSAFKSVNQKLLSLFP